MFQILCFLIKNGKTLYELWFEHTHTISHFCMFWCKLFVLKSKNLDKFEARSTGGIFLGYSTHSHDYCILVLEFNKIIKTCEVTFNDSSVGTSSSIVCTSADAQEESIFVVDDEE